MFELTVQQPGASALRATLENGAYLIGEAAGFISASSFEGLSSAMLSAKLLADAFIKNGKNVKKAYKRKTISLKLKLYSKAIKRAILCNPLTRKIIMKSGIQSITPYTKNNNRRIKNREESIDE